MRASGLQARQARAQYVAHQSRAWGVCRLPRLPHMDPEPSSDDHGRRRRILRERRGAEAARGERGDSDAFGEQLA